MPLFNRQLTSIGVVEPNVLINNQAQAPDQYIGIDGSLGKGAFFADTKRTGGFGAYGNILLTCLVTAPTPATEFDVGITSWMTATNMTASGASIFGMWSGANTPSSSIGGQTYTGGAAIGMEINVGNRWADEGYQQNLGGTRYTVGLQIVPDVIPAADGVTAPIYAGTFGLVIGRSIHGHRWWTGSTIPYDTLKGGGIGHMVIGASSPGAGEPHSALSMAGYMVYGIDFTLAAFSKSIMNIPGGSLVGAAGAGSGQVPPTQVENYFVVSVSGNDYLVPLYKKP